jgi:hypothetical protein
VAVRLSAAIRGAAIMLFCSSAAIARTEIRAVHSYAADGTAIVGAASMYNPYRPGYREGALRQLQESAIIHLRGPLRSKPICVKGLAAFTVARGQAMPWSRVPIRRRSSK